MNMIYYYLIGLFSGILTGSFFGYLMFIRVRKSNRHQHSLAYQYARQNILEDIVRETTCANAILLKIHNCGGKLEEGKPWYSSVVAEAPERNIVSVMNKWQDQDVDEPYKELIRKLQTTGRTTLKTDEMRDKEFLKRIYVRMNITGSLVMEIYRNEYAYYYMSCPIREDFHMVTDLSEFNRYEMGAILMKKLLSKYDELDVLVLE